MKQWSKIMLERMAELKPLVLCFNGKGIYEVYSGKKCQVGIQEERLPGTDTVSLAGGWGDSCRGSPSLSNVGGVRDALDIRPGCFTPKEGGQTGFLS